MNWQFVIELIIIAFLLHCSLDSHTADGAKKRKKGKKSEAAQSNGEDKEIQFTSQQDLEAKMADVKRERQRKALEEDLSPAKRRQLEEEEEELYRDVLRAELNYGEVSREKAAALHKFGGNIYKQGRYSEVLQLSKEIVKIHEQLDGVDDIQTARALGNVGSVSFRIGSNKLCDVVMKRALYIINEYYGDTSKESLMHRGKMLTFQVPDAEDTEGFDYEDYMIEMGKIEDDGGEL